MSNSVSVIVALRKESVDRNAEKMLNRMEKIMSLSARRAWIEIDGCISISMVSNVALRKESVDRNINYPEGYEG